MEALFLKLEKDLPKSNKLSKFEIFYIVLVRMRIDLSFTYLAYQFDTTRTTISTYWHKGLEVFYSRFRSLVYFSKREDIKRTMPAAFQLSFGDKISVILDCFELFTERNSNIKTANQTWSNYKHAHTAKYLIGTAPQRVIIFISDAYGGRASKFVVEDSGFLNLLEDGDVVMADRGFLIEDELKKRVQA